MDKRASTLATHLTRGAFFLVLIFLAFQMNPSAYPSGGYYVTEGTGTIVPGTTDTGNHCDDCTTSISLPFSYQLYDQIFTGVNVSSNGNLQFVSNSNVFDNACPLSSANLNHAIMPHWDDLSTGQVGPGCTGYASGCGIFTSTSGTAPNRIFNIEWRTVYDNTTRANFEVRLYEGQNRFALVYGEVVQGGSSATVGVQEVGNFSMFECNTAGSLTSGLRLVFTERCPFGEPDPDFNNDRRTDYLLYNGATGRTAIWFLDYDNSLIGSAFGPTPPPGWNVIDVADFDFDGHVNVDYALFNATTRETAIWYLVGTSFSSSAFGPMLPSGWALVAVGDFNGDCQPDYLLYNSSTRRTAVWYLINNVFTGSASGPTLPAGWRVAGVADFDDDSNRDYALFNATTRQTAIWYLVGTTFMSGAFGPTPPAGWQLIGVADFDGDGGPDYLLFNATTRRTAVWYLNNNVFVSGAFGPTTPAGWQLVAP